MKRLSKQQHVILYSILFISVITVFIIAILSYTNTQSTLYVSTKSTKDQDIGYIHEYADEDGNLYNTGLYKDSSDGRFKLIDKPLNDVSQISKDINFTTSDLTSLDLLSTRITSGSVNEPSISFHEKPTTGFYLENDTLKTSLDGVEVVSVNQSGVESQQFTFESGLYKGEDVRYIVKSSYTTDYDGKSGILFENQTIINGVYLNGSFNIKPGNDTTQFDLSVHKGNIYTKTHNVYNIGTLTEAWSKVYIGNRLVLEGTEFSAAELTNGGFDQTLNTSDNVEFNGIIVDGTDSEAFTVRQNGNGTDVFTVNTSTSTVTITGDLNIIGNMTQTSSNSISISDNFIELANSNVTSDLIDAGFYITYSADAGVSESYAGIVRDATNGNFVLVKDISTEPGLGSTWLADYSSNYANLTLETINVNGNLTMGATTVSEAELAVIDGVTSGVATASKALVVDASKNLTSMGNITCGILTSISDTPFMVDRPIDKFRSLITGGIMYMQTYYNTDTQGQLWFTAYSSTANMLKIHLGANTVVSNGNTEVNGTLTTTDNVAIGTGTFSRRLHVYDASGSTLKLSSSSGGLDMIQNNPSTWQISAHGATTTLAHFGFTEIKLDCKTSINGPLIAGAGSTTADTGTGTFGVAKIGNWDADYAGFGHSALTMNNTNYAILQASNGSTFLNSAETRSLYFRINNVDAMRVNSSRHVELDNNLLMGTSDDTNSFNVTPAWIWGQVSSSCPRITIDGSNTTPPVLNLQNDLDTDGNTVGAITFTKTLNPDAHRQVGTIIVRQDNAGGGSLFGGKLFINLKRTGFGMASEGTVSIDGTGRAIFGLFSLNSTDVGTVTAGRARIGNYNTGLCGFGHSALGLNADNAAISQNSVGLTKINATVGQAIDFYVDGTEYGRIAQAYTRFNNETYVTIGAVEKFRVASSTSIFNTSLSVTTGNVTLSGSANGSKLLVSNSEATVSATLIPLNSTQQFITIKNTNATNNNWGLIAWENNLGTIASAIGTQYIDQASAYADFAFSTRGSLGYTEKMRITSNGNVYIDTDTLYVDAVNDRVYVNASSNQFNNEALQVVGSTCISDKLVVNPTASNSPENSIRIGGSVYFGEVDSHTTIKNINANKSCFFIRAPGLNCHELAFGTLESYLCILGGNLSVGYAQGASPGSDFNVNGNSHFNGTLTVTGNLIMGSTIVSEAEIGVLDGVTPGTVTASKALVVDANRDLATVRNLTSDGNFLVGGATTSVYNGNGSLQIPGVNGSNSYVTVEGVAGSAPIINLQCSSGVSEDTLGALVFSRTDGQNDAHRNVAGIYAKQIGTGTTAGSHMVFYTKNIVVAEAMHLNNLGTLAIGYNTSTYVDVGYKLDVSGNTNVSQTLTSKELIVYDPDKLGWTGGDLWHRKLESVKDTKPGGVPTWRTFDTIQWDGTSGFAWSGRLRYQVQSRDSIVAGGGDTRSVTIRAFVNSNGETGNINENSYESEMYSFTMDNGVPFFEIPNSLTCGAGSTTTDTGTGKFGIAKIGNYTTNTAAFWHSAVPASLNNVAIYQLSNGETNVQAVSGQHIHFQTDGKIRMKIADAYVQMFQQVTIYDTQLRLLNAYGGSKLEIHNTKDNSGFASGVPVDNIDSFLRLQNDENKNNVWSFIQADAPNASRIVAIGFKCTSTTGGSESGLMSIATKNAGTMTEKMRITESGNVLIGTTTDNGFKLDVNGNINCDSFYTSTGQINFNYSGSIEGGQINFINTSYNTINFDHYADNMRMFTNSANNSELQLHNDGSGAFSLRVTGSIASYDFGVSANNVLVPFYGSNSTTDQYRVIFSSNVTYLQSFNNTSNNGNMRITGYTDTDLTTFRCRATNHYFDVGSSANTAVLQISQGKVYLANDDATAGNNLVLDHIIFKDRWLNSNTGLSESAKIRIRRPVDGTTSFDMVFQTQNNPSGLRDAMIIHNTRNLTIFGGIGYGNEASAAYAFHNQLNHVSNVYSYDQSALNASANDQDMYKLINRQYMNPIGGVTSNYCTGTYQQLIMNVPLGVVVANANNMKLVGPTNDGSGTVTNALTLGIYKPTIGTNTNQALYVEGFDCVGNSTLTGVFSITANSQSLSLIGVNHTYMAYYPEGLGAGRKAYIGYPSGGSTVLTIRNEYSGVANGDIDLNTEDTIRLTAPSTVLTGTLTATAINVGESNMDYYENTSFTTNWSGPYTGGSAGTSTVYIVRVGKSVTLTVQSYAEFGDIASTMTNNTAIGVNYRPNIIVYGFVLVTDGTGTYTQGNFSINTSGTITVGKLDESSFTYTGGAANVGFKTFTICYQVP